LKTATGLDWSGWTDTEKPVDPTRPFHRINCPTVNGPKADGRGYDCGCRVEDDIPTASLLEDFFHIIGSDLRQVIRTVPSWVPVKINGQRITTPQEVEGILIRSFQTWTDFPLFQWHRWYDWNFMIIPAPSFDYLRGAANIGPVIFASESDGFNQPVVRDFTGPLGTGEGTMECEFDCGLWGSRFTNKHSPQSFGPMFHADWAWPMTGQFFWGMGQWVYDCGHPTNSIKTGPNAGLTRSELHPCHAIATARWEAVKFKENGDFFVPAIQFMFFATAQGGYTDPERVSKLPTKDIEFIVDLPKCPMHQGPFPIGHTPEVPHNTIQMPRLLKDTQFGNFSAALNFTSGAKKFQASAVEPIVEPIRDKDNPNGPPKQVKVTIPFANGINPNADYYGVILSLGWLDTDLSQARRVRKVKVTVDRVVAQGNHDKVGDGEWNIRASVNGRWLQRRHEDVEDGMTIPINRAFEFHLADDDMVWIAAHGEETDLVHDIYLDRTDAERVLFLFRSGIPIIGPLLSQDARPVNYFGDCLDKRDGGGGDVDMAREVVSEIISELRSTFNVQSDPLGRIDPFFITRGGIDTENPILVSKVGATLSGQQTGLLTREVGSSAELAEADVGKKGKDDYTIFYKIEVTPQIVGT